MSTIFILNTNFRTHSFSSRLSTNHFIEDGYWLHHIQQYHDSSIFGARFYTRIICNREVASTDFERLGEFSKIFNMNL